MSEADLNALSLEELEALLERDARVLELKLQGASDLERRELLADHYGLERVLRAKQREHYRSLELPEPLGDLTPLSLDELRELAKLVSLKLYALTPSSAFEPEEHERLGARRSALAKQNKEILDTIDRRLAEDYEPSPDGPPAYEPRGCSAEMGFVKSQAANNGYYLKHWQNHPWYPAILGAHEELEALIPGYNIAQLKEKFGTLRYYIDFPESVVGPEWPGIVPEDIREKADAIIREAEQRASIISQSLKNRG